MHDFLHNNSLFDQIFIQDLECTIAQRVTVTNNLLVALDKGLLSVYVLLDLSAAFDTIDHHILLQRLELLIGIKGTAFCTLTMNLPCTCKGLKNVVYTRHKYAKCKELNIDRQELKMVKKMLKSHLDYGTVHCKS